MTLKSGKLSSAVLIDVIRFSAHLESLRCPAVTYTQELFSDVFASFTDDDTCNTLWDLYIEKGDPFLIFHMAVVLLINAREEILKIGYSDRFEFQINSLILI